MQSSMYISLTALVSVLATSACQEQCPAGSGIQPVEIPVTIIYKSCLWMMRLNFELIIGYVFHADGSMHPVSECDLQLVCVAEDGNDPVDCKLNFIAGHVRYSMQIHLLERPVFYMGDEHESRIHERMCKFVINGTRVGYGISEWCYRNLKGKLDDYSAHLAFSQPSCALKAQQPTSL